MARWLFTGPAFHDADLWRYVWHLKRRDVFGRTFMVLVLGMVVLYFARSSIFPDALYWFWFLACLVASRSDASRIHELSKGWREEREKLLRTIEQLEKVQFERNTLLLEKERAERNQAG
jgi:hypothetical protein